MFPIGNPAQMLDVVIDRSLFETKRFIGMLRKGEAGKEKLVLEWMEMERELLRKTMSQTQLFALNLPDGKIPDALVDTIIPALEELTSL